MPGDNKIHMEAPAGLSVYFYNFIYTSPITIDVWR